MHRQSRHPEPESIYGARREHAGVGHRQVLGQVVVEGAETGQILRREVALVSERVAREKRIAADKIMVHSSGGLIGEVAPGAQVEVVVRVGPAAFQIGQRNDVEHRKRHCIELGNGVAGKRIAKDFRIARTHRLRRVEGGIGASRGGVVNRSAALTEIPLPLGQRGHRLDLRHAVNQAEAFIVRKEKGPVFLNGSAGRSSELVLDEVRDLARVIERARVEGAVADEFINIGVELVAS